MIYKPMQLSKDFYLSEFTESDTAEEEGIDNTPNAQEIQNLRVLSQRVLQPIRSFLSRPVSVNSGYRCPKLNEAVGGVSDSRHKSGKAADIKVEGLAAEDLAWMIRQTDLPFEDVVVYDTHVHIEMSDNI